MSNVIQFPVIAGIEIHTDDEGRFNLNALHKASGLAGHKKPSEWLRSKQVQELINELEGQSGNSRSAHKVINVVNGGTQQGTFAHELLVVSYAAWINPRFHLQVNQMFIDYKKGTLVPLQQPAQLSRLDILKIAIEAEQENERLSNQMEEQKPKLQALERLSGAEGDMCITDAAKQLQTAPRKLFRILSERQWIYKRAGSNHWVAYQGKIQQSLVSHKTYTIKKTDMFEGHDRIVQQVQITPKGLARLSELLSNEVAA